MKMEERKNQSLGNKIVRMPAAHYVLAYLSNLFFPDPVKSQVIDFRLELSGKTKLRCKAMSCDGRSLQRSARSL